MAVLNPPAGAASQDLYNVASVRLAEATRVRLYLPGLNGEECPEAGAEDTGRSSGNSEDARKARKKMQQMQSYVQSSESAGPSLAGEVIVLQALLAPLGEDSGSEADVKDEAQQEKATPCTKPNGGSSLQQTKRGGSRVNNSPSPASSPSYPTLPKPSTAGPYLSRPVASSTHPGAGPGGPSSSPGAAWSGEPAITSRAATAAPSNTAISKEAHRANNAQWLDPHRVPIWERPLAPPRRQQLAQQQAAQQHQMFQQMVAQQQLHQQAVQQHMLQQYHHMHQQQYVLMGTEEAGVDHHQPAPPLITADTSLPSFPSPAPLCLLALLPAEFGQQRSGERPATQTVAYPPPFSATPPAPGSGRPYALAPAAGQDVALGRPVVPEAVRAGQGGRGAPADPGVGGMLGQTGQAPLGGMGRRGTGGGGASRISRGSLAGPFAGQGVGRASPPPGCMPAGGLVAGALPKGRGQLAGADGMQAGPRVALPQGLEQLRDEAQQHWQTASAAHGALSSAMADALGQAASPGDGSGSKALPVSRLAQAHAGRSRS
ncbi:hypothetical protein QJQ45_023518 [Haematococcus lacustris]|nr:hypothetical protein QJQ45_023518 [Haematococcus lacustris]